MCDTYRYSDISIQLTSIAIRYLLLAYRYTHVALLSMRNFQAHATEKNGSDGDRAECKTLPAPRRVEEQSMEILWVRY